MSDEYDNWISIEHPQSLEALLPIGSLIAVVPILPLQYQWYLTLRDLLFCSEDGGGSFLRNVGAMCKISWRYISEYRLSYMRILCWKVSIVWGLLNMHDFSEADWATIAKYNSIIQPFLLFISSR